MGTSKPSSGAGSRTPYVPPWNDNPSADSQGGAAAGSGENVQEEGETPEPNRFRLARANFTRFLTSGGKDRGALKGAISSYISKSCGGTEKAAKRMKASQRATAKLFGILNDISEKGIDEALKQVSLEGLIGHSPEEVLIELQEIICESGGRIDQNIAREACVQIFNELAEILHRPEDLTSDRVIDIAIEFVNNCLLSQIINDIGLQIEKKIVSVEQAKDALSDLEGFISDTIKGRLRDELKKARNLSQKQIFKEMEKIYRIAFDLLEIKATE